jgi:predicted nucleic acid-binding protein
MVSANPPRRIFLDSSALYAAAFSATGPARRLILKGLEGSITLAISDLVLEETKRNLTKNAPLALPSFTQVHYAFLTGLILSATSRIRWEPLINSQPSRS